MYFLNVTFLSDSWEIFCNAEQLSALGQLKMYVCSSINHKLSPYFRLSFLCNLISFYWFSGSALVLSVVYWITNIFFMILDLNGKPAFLVKYKIEQKKNVPVRQLIWNSFISKYNYLLKQHLRRIKNNNKFKLIMSLF